MTHASSNGQTPWELRPETVLIDGGRPAKDPGAPMNVPLVPASTFRAGSPREYARSDGTDSWVAFEEVLGRLEGGQALAFSTGMAAIAAVLETLPVGATVLLPRDVYMGTRAMLQEGEALGRWRPQPVDLSSPESLAPQLEQADLLWVETPSNPMLEVCDLREVVGAARAAGVPVVVDNTFATPLLQRPLSLGADVVVHSATKFIGGHSDLLMGVAVTADPQTYERLRRRRSLAGATPGALECFLALRGIRTMAVRVAAAQASAQELARRLADHPAVMRVHYPGLPEDPGHAVARRQMDGFGAMLSFELADAATADAACRALIVISHATSLGGVESTMERRGQYPGSEHVPPGLLRLSVGCEHVEDLWQDLERALS